MYPLFKELLNESKLYRGIGKGSSTTGIQWWSTDLKLSKGYADARNGKVISVDKSLGNIVNLSQDNLRVSPSSLFAMVSKQSDIDKTDKSPLKFRKEMIEHYGKHERKISDYWKNPQDSKNVEKLLKLFGFDTIELLEDGVKTYGILPNNSE